MRSPCIIIGLLIFMMASCIDCCHGNPCQHMLCKNPSHECRAVRICDVNGSCDAVLSACGPKVESDGKQKPCEHGQPVVDLSGLEVACGEANDKLCPFGFHCHHQLCCPTKSDIRQGLPRCDEEENLNAQISTSSLTLNLNLCIDRCQSDADCRGDGHICCINDCSSQCRESGHQTASTISSSRTPTNTTVPPLASDASYASSTSSTHHPSTPSPSYSNELKTSHIPRDTAVSSEPRENIDVAEIQADPTPIPKESRGRKGPVRAPSLNRGMDVTPPLNTVEKPHDGDMYNNLDNPARNHPQKAGQCPSQPKLTICGQPTCTMDERCPGPTKCCVTHCGRICVTPQEATDRLNKLRPNIFRDIGFGKPRHSFEQPKAATNSEVFGSSFSNYGLDFALRGPDGSQQNSRFGFSPPDSYAGLYRHEDGPLYSYGFRPSSSDSIGNSLLESNSPEVNVKFNPNPKNNHGVREAGTYKEDSGILGYTLPFSNNNRRPFAGNNGDSSSRTTGRSPGFALSPVIAGRPNNFESFPGYGPNGFTDSTSGLNYGRLDPGRFGGIDKKDYEKLGLAYPSSDDGKTGS